MPHRCDGGFEALDGPKSETDRSRELAAAVHQRNIAVVAKRHAKLDALGMFDDFDLGDLIRRSDHAFRQREADGEIFQILRRRHHDGIGRTPISEGDGRFLRHDPRAVRDAASADDETRDFHSAGSAWTMRRLCSACAPYSRCQSVGPLEGETFTAVTLYSGQFVA